MQFTHHHKPHAIPTNFKWNNFKIHWLITTRVTFLTFSLTKKKVCSRNDNQYRLAYPPLLKWTNSNLTGGGRWLAVAETASHLPTVGHFAWNITLLPTSYSGSQWHHCILRDATSWWTAVTSQLHTTDGTSGRAQCALAAGDLTLIWHSQQWGEPSEPISALHGRSLFRQHQCVRCEQECN